MTTRAVKLLLVEDEAVQRLKTERFLKSMTDYSFDVRHAESEDAALEEFGRGGIDFVILDYHLTSGDGLSCLRRLRERDPMVPVVAVSGVATPEIAAELVRAGADDYLSKHDLRNELLTASIRAALNRADVFRRLHSPDGSIRSAAVETKVAELVRDLAAIGDGAFLRCLDQLDSAVREAGLTVSQIEPCFRNVMGILESDQTKNIESAKRLLRLILLEILVRLSEQESERQSGK